MELTLKLEAPALGVPELCVGSRSDPAPNDSQALAMAIYSATTPNGSQAQAIRSAPNDSQALAMGGRRGEVGGER